jgi:hypothetical protein
MPERKKLRCGIQADAHILWVQRAGAFLGVGGVRRLVHPRVGFGELDLRGGRCRIGPRRILELDDRLRMLSGGQILFAAREEPLERGARACRQGSQGEHERGNAHGYHSGKC